MPVTASHAANAKRDLELSRIRKAPPWGHPVPSLPNQDIETYARAFLLVLWRYDAARARIAQQPPLYLGFSRIAAGRRIGTNYTDHRHK